MTNRSLPEPRPRPPQSHIFGRLRHSALSLPPLIKDSEILRSRHGKPCHPIKKCSWFQKEVYTCCFVSKQTPVGKSWIIQKNQTGRSRYELPSRMGGYGIKNIRWWFGEKCPFTHSRAPLLAWLFLQQLRIKPQQGAPEINTMRVLYLRRIPPHAKAK